MLELHRVGVDGLEHGSMLVQFGVHRVEFAGLRLEFAANSLELLVAAAREEGVA